MDDPGLPRDEHEQALIGLSRLNRASGVVGTTYAYLRKYALARPNRLVRVLDVASGAGDIPIGWAKRARCDGIEMQFTTVDASPAAIAYQQQRAAEAAVELNSIEMNCLKSPLPTGFDIVTCSLFMHHLDDHQAFRLLQSMQSATEGWLVICDLDRSRMNLALVSLGAHLLTRSHIVHTDASLSVRAAYTCEEFKVLAEQALARPVRIRRSFPCRFVASFEEKIVSQPVVAFA